MLDLTALANQGLLTPAVDVPRTNGERSQLYEQIARGLFRRSGGNVLLTGERGVGK